MPHCVTNMEENSIRVKIIFKLKFNLYLPSYPIPFSAYHQGVDMSMGDYDGRTALHLSSAEGHIRCVRFLLDICKVKHNPKDRLVKSREL